MIHFPIIIAVTYIATPTLYGLLNSFLRIHVIFLEVHIGVLY